MNDDILRIFVSGELRELPRAEWDALQGPKPPHPETFIGNGCTCSPDVIMGKRVWPACVLHDYHYNETHLAMPRKAADDYLRENIKVILKADGMFGPLASVLAWAYYRVVRREGRRFYNAGGDPA